MRVLRCRLSRFFYQKLFVMSLSLCGLAINSTSFVLSEDDKVPKDAPASADVKDESVAVKQSDSTTLKALLAKKEYDAAIELVDRSIAENPDASETPSLELNLGMGLLRAARSEQAMTRFSEMVDRYLNVEPLNANQLQALVTATNYLTQMNRKLTDDERIAIVDRTLTKIGDQTSPSLKSAIGMLNGLKIRSIVASGRMDEAKTLLDQSLIEARNNLDEKLKPSITEYLKLASTYISTLSPKFAEEVKAVMEDADEAANAFIARDNVNASDFGAYFGYKSGVISVVGKNNAELAKSHIDALSEALESLASRLEPDEAKKLASYKSNIGSLRTRNESALKHQRLVGQAAPEIDAEHFVASESVTLKSLRGKVVLIDFWAVWCGPCIATFPHLIEWHERYADKGLVILGATRSYGYRWDDEADKAVKPTASSGDKVAIEEELAMLEKFRAKYKLHHGFFVSPQGSTFNADYGVYGIPQAVLIDKEGKVQLIRTGSGENNAKEIEAKIQTLLEQ